MIFILLLQEALQGVPGEPHQRPLPGPRPPLRGQRGHQGLRALPGGHAEGGGRGRGRLPRSTPQGEATTLWGRRLIRPAPRGWSHCCSGNPLFGSPSK